MKKYKVFCLICGLEKVFSGEETIKNIDEQIKKGVKYSKCDLCGSLNEIKKYLDGINVL